MPFFSISCSILQEDFEMNQSYFEVFLAVVECKSVSRAAEKLFLSQSTVSHRLKMLENEIGCLLFERAQGQRECVLTAKGEALLPFARRWIELSKDTKNFSKMNFAPVVTIGAVTSLNRCVLYGFYNRLLNGDFPFRLDIKSYGNEILYTNVANGFIDLALTVEHIRNKTIDTKELFSERMVFVCCPGQYPSRVIHPNELDPANEISIHWDARDIQFWHEQWFTPNAESYLSINDPSLVHYFFKGGTWAIVPISIGVFLQNRHGLETHELLLPPPKRICYILKSRFLRPERIKYIDLIEKELKQYLAELDWPECAFGEKAGHA